MENVANTSSIFSSDGPICSEQKTLKYLSDKRSCLLVGAILAIFWSFNLF